jgi:hypothetical protein
VPDVQNAEQRIWRNGAPELPHERVPAFHWEATRPLDSAVSRSVHHCPDVVGQWCYK